MTLSSTYSVSRQTLRALIERRDRLKHITLPSEVADQADAIVALRTRVNAAVGHHRRLKAEFAALAREEEEPEKRPHTTEALPSAGRECEAGTVPLTGGDATARKGESELPQAKEGLSVPARGNEQPCETEKDSVALGNEALQEPLRAVLKVSQRENKILLIRVGLGIPTAGIEDAENVPVRVNNHCQNVRVTVAAAPP
jgi:hypothetical protein